MRALVSAALVLLCLPAAASADVWLDGEDGPSELAADATHLYWLNVTDTECIVRRRALSGGDPQTLGRVPGACAAIHRVADGLLLATSRGTFFMNPVTAAPQQHLSFEAGESVLGLEILAGHMVLRTTSALYEIERSGTSRLSTQSDAVLAADGRHLYLGRHDGRVTRRPWSGGDEEELTRVRGSRITGLQLADGRLYFAHQVSPGNGPPPHEGGIAWMRTSGGAPTWLVRDQRVGWMLLHGGRIHFRVGQERFAVPTRGGTPTRAGFPFPGTVLPVGDGALFAAEGPYGRRIHRFELR